jgi:hypothetical protein
MIVVADKFNVVSASLDLVFVLFAERLVRRERAAHEFSTSALFYECAAFGLCAVDYDYYVSHFFLLCVCARM